MKVSLSLSLMALVSQAAGFAPSTKMPSRGQVLEASNANEFNPMKKGSSVALVTPFTETGAIDMAAYEKLLQWHVDSGTDNLCILGTTGEASVMSKDERAKVLQLAVKVCKGKMPILAGVGTINPNAVKEQILQAIDIGCDAGLVVTPYYVKPPQRGLIKHFTDAADLGLPVVVYNVPGRTASNLEDASMALISKHENIVGLKDATGDLGRLANLLKLLKEDGDTSLLQYSGDDGTSLDFVMQGGDGCISVTANVAPREMHELMMAALNGDEATAKAINDKLDILHNKLFVEANPIPAKYAVYKIGKMPLPYCRPPLDALDSKFHKDMEKWLKEAGCLQTA